MRKWGCFMQKTVTRRDEEGYTGDDSKSRRPLTRRVGSNPTFSAKAVLCRIKPQGYPCGFYFYKQVGDLPMLNEFHRYVGKLMMHCQRIEHDIKLIYAGYLEGDFDENYSKIETMTLGQVLHKLQQLDNSDGNPYFSQGDYKLLSEITRLRNHWAHTGYTLFLYENGNSYHDAFSKQRRRLINDCNRLEKLSGTIEKVRLTLLKDCGRI